MALALDGLGDRQAAIERAGAALAIFEQLEHPSAEKVQKRLAE